MARTKEISRYVFVAHMGTRQDIPTPTIIIILVWPVMRPELGAGSLSSAICVKRGMRVRASEVVLAASGKIIVRGVRTGKCGVMRRLLWEVDLLSTHMRSGTKTRFKDERVTDGGEEGRLGDIEREGREGNISTTDIRLTKAVD